MNMWLTFFKAIPFDFALHFEHRKLIPSPVQIVALVP